MGRNNKRTLLPGILKKLVLFYILYAIATGVIAFAFYDNNQGIQLNKHQTDRFFSDEVGPDRIVLIEERKYSGVTRLNLIENAEETLDIIYFSTEDGQSSDIFYGKIFEAADRGVRVRILIDGIIHSFKGPSDEVLYAIKSHPNIELKLYEPLDLVKPWTWNNRLHDKHIIADSKMAMIGGRNIGDRYFIDTEEGDIVHDRDVLIINTGPTKSRESAVYEMEDYFDMVWDHEFSKDPIKSLNETREKKGNDRRAYLKEYIKTIEKTHPQIFNTHIDWLDRSVPTNKITLIYNPIGRFNKEPRILTELLGLMEEAKNSIVIQSPYIVPTRGIKRYVPLDDIKDKEITILTNSLKSSANYPGVSSYMSKRGSIINFTDYLYEYQGIGSIHGKSYIIDDRISLVGSFNLDPRSAFLSTETMVVIDSKEFTDILKNQMGDLIDQSLLVGNDGAYVEDHLQQEEASMVKRLIVNILSKITFLFEYLI